MIMMKIIIIMSTWKQIKFPILFCFNNCYTGGWSERDIHKVYQKYKIIIKVLLKGI